MDKEAIKERLVREGFTIVHEYDDAPNELFPDHTHPTDQLVVVITGSISFTMNGQTTVSGPGDEMYFPAHTIHSAQVGPEGCFYLDGEKPEA